MHPLEIEALREIVSSAGADPKKAETSVIDLRLTYGENKRIIKDWLKAEGKSMDLRTEIVAGKELETKMSAELQAAIEEKEKEKYKAVSGKKKEIDSKVEAMGPEIIKEISAYNPYMENVTYATLFACMNGRIGKQKTNVINMGKHGIGKSRGTSDLLTKLEIADAVIIRGFMTPRKVYDTLKANPSSILCFDEAENIMNDEMCMFILRPAMFGGEVSWLSSKGDALDTFNFTGTIIANMNHFGVTEAAAAPLFDRTLFHQTNLDNVQLVEKMQTKKTYHMNEDIWQVIKDKITLIRGEGLSELTEAEEDYVMAYIVKVASSASVFNKSLSVRAHGRATLVARCLKSLFLRLDAPIKELFEQLSKTYISNDDADDICVKILRQSPNVTRRELAEIISENRQISERQASRQIKAAIERGVLTAVNRTKVVVTPTAKVVK